MSPLIACEGSKNEVSGVPSGRRAAARAKACESVMMSDGGGKGGECALHALGRAAESRAALVQQLADRLHLGLDQAPFGCLRILGQHDEEHSVARGGQSGRDFARRIVGQRPHEGKASRSSARPLPCVADTATGRRPQRFPMRAAAASPDRTAGRPSIVRPPRGCCVRAGVRATLRSRRGGFVEQQHHRDVGAVERAARGRDAARPAPPVRRRSPECRSARRRRVPAARWLSTRGRWSCRGGRRRRRSRWPVRGVDEGRFAAAASAEKGDVQAFRLGCAVVHDGGVSVCGPGWGCLCVSCLCGQAARSGSRSLWGREQY